jgi:hypothetical protein
LTDNRFPENPANGDIFELQDGVLYEYDISINSWIKIASNTVNLPLATHASDGSMSATDLKKLNRLVLPPPSSSITGNDCYAPFERGVISLKSADDFVNVEGNVTLQNIDNTGTRISQTMPFHIHQHTYGFDFNLDINELIDELVARGQFKTVGPIGERGDKGITGENGIDRIPSGPQGAKGEQGLAPECTLDVQTEILQANVNPGLKRALTAVRVVVDEDDYEKYSLEFDRQVIGRTDITTSLFKVRQQKSSWVLAVGSVAGTPQKVYYLDVDPIINKIHDKFLAEIDRLKTGYETITKFWAQIMSDMFDEQKAALCCALEFCQSKTKSDGLRRHMESVAASALPDARIKVHERGVDERGYQLESGTGLWPRVGQTDLCWATAASADADAEAVKAFAVPEDDYIVVDPILHISSSNASTIILDKGTYVASIDSFDAQIEGEHFADLMISYAKGPKSRTARFLNKGTFSSLLDAKSAYEGLSLAFDHDGGEVGAYFYLLPTSNASGNITIKITKEETLVPAAIQSEVVEKSKPKSSISGDFSCLMDIVHLSWYERGWDNGQCCGLVVNLNGQDYIIVKRSIGSESCCGGGESPQTPCISKFSEVGHPAFAWPTLDGKTFAPIPEINKVSFKYDEFLNTLATTKIANGEFNYPKGNPSGVRHLAFQLDFILFPTT